MQRRDRLWKLIGWPKGNKLHKISTSECVILGIMPKCIMETSTIPNMKILRGKKIYIYLVSLQPHAQQRYSMDRRNSASSSGKDFLRGAGKCPGHYVIGG